MSVTDVFDLTYDYCNVSRQPRKFSSHVNRDLSCSQILAPFSFSLACAFPLMLLLVLPDANGHMAELTGGSATVQYFRFVIAYSCTSKRVDAVMSKSTTVEPRYKKGTAIPTPDLAMPTP
jgi:hypothetical protein